MINFGPQKTHKETYNQSQNQSESTLIEIKKLAVIFGRKPHLATTLLEQNVPSSQIYRQTGQMVALSSINLSVKKGEIFVLMGLSGSGKSTLLRCINGLVTPSQGTITLEFENQKVDIQHSPPPLLRKMRMHFISMVFQQFGLLPWKTVAENVAFPLELQKKSPKEYQEKVEYYLELVHLKDWSHKYPHQLSGGMQQRVGLARALVTDAEILLMDEPFSALDPLIRKELQDELLELQQKLHKTILFVSHDFDEALKIATRMGIMEGGKLLMVGTPQEIIKESHLNVIKIHERPLVLENQMGQFLGVVGGQEIFKRLIKDKQ